MDGATTALQSEIPPPPPIEWRRDRALLIPLLLILLCGIALFRDYREEYFGPPGSEAVGSVERSGGDVKRRPSDRFRWFDVSSGSRLFAKDSIRTADASSTSLDLPGGAKLDLGQNSLVFLSWVNGKIQVEIARGEGSFKGGGGMLLRAKGKTFELGQAAGKVSVDDGQLLLKVDSGKALSAGAAPEIGANQQLRVTDDGKTELLQSPAELLEPKAGAFITAESDRPASIRFSWKPLKPGMDLKLEIARNPNFLRAIRALPATDTKRDVSLEAGTYYWRISGARSWASETRSFEVGQRVSIQLLDPPDGATLSYGRVPPETVFSWTRVAGFDQYRLELSARPDFESVAKTIDAGSREELRVQVPELARMYWRVQASSSRSAMRETSQSRSLVLSKSATAFVPKPLSPPLSAPATGGVDGIRVPFRWTRAEGADSYVVEVSRSSDFAKSEAAMATPAPSAEWTAPKPGRYFWRVSTVDSKGKKIQTSKPQPFLAVLEPPLELIEPADHARIPMDSAKPKVGLKWEDAPGAAAYQVEIARDPEFSSSAFTSRHPGTELEVSSLGEGLYFWRVLVLDRAGNPARISETQTFQLTAGDLLGAPKLKSPAPGASMGAANLRKAQWELSWERVSGAKQYEVIVSPQDGAPIIKRVSGTRTAFRGLAASRYRWEVRSVDSRGRTGKAGDPWAFSVIKKSGPRAPDVLGVEVKYIKK